MKLVECIPNFSEGRRGEIVDAIEQAISQAAPVQILDRHSDHDHNRSVVTFAGTPEAVQLAAFAGISKAAELIDLEQHQGEHPRLGATDVVPFVPLAGSTMEECVQLARSLGERVGTELGIPVYLYEAAATRADRVSLEDVRRGEYEALKASIATDPDRVPDYGPTQLSPAGATIIGARKPLIAFNVYLTTDEVEVAKRIAKAVRHSSGGLRFTKALGMLVEGKAQVSMNLTDFERTPIHRVIELIRREAERNGVAIHHTELVGLAPQAAMVQAAQWYLQLDGFQPDQLLENRLFEAGSTTAPPFLEQLAAGSATPGGGSAAAYAGAMSAALLTMVTRLTIGKKGYAEVEQRMQQIEARTLKLNQELEADVEADAQAFESVMQALRMPKGTPEEAGARQEALQAATLQAAEVPLRVASRATELLALAAEVAEHGNRNAVSDSGTAGAMATAALRAASLNVGVNASSLKDEQVGRPLIERVAELNASAAVAQQALDQILRQRLDLAE